MPGCLRRSGTALPAAKPGIAPLPVALPGLALFFAAADCALTWHADVAQVRAGGRKCVAKEREIRDRDNYIPSTDPYSVAGAGMRQCGAVSASAAGVCCLQFQPRLLPHIQ